MKLGLFIPTNNRTPDTVAPSIWIRALQFIPVWKNHGVNLSINRFFKRYDCAIVYRSLELSTIFKILWLKLTSQKVFYDQ